MLGGRPLSVSRKTAFHWTNRADGQSVLAPAASLYGPAQGLQFSSALDVLPERT